MNYKWNFILLLFILAFMGCTLTHTHTNNVPQEIYTKAKPLPIANMQVGIFFLNNSNSGNPSSIAAQALYSSLLKKANDNKENKYNCIFRKLVLENDTKYGSIKEVISAARKKKYDIAIIGDVLYSFDGTYLSSTTCYQSIHVFRLLGKDEKILFYAKASEVEEATPSKDYLLFKTSPKPAPSLGLLMNKIAERFTNAICESETY